MRAQGAKVEETSSNEDSSDAAASATEGRRRLLRKERSLEGEGDVDKVDDSIVLDSLATDDKPLKIKICVGADENAGFDTIQGL